MKVNLLISLRQEDDNPRRPGWAQCNHESLNGEVGAEEVRVIHVRIRPLLLDLGPSTKDYGQPPDADIIKDSSLESPERTQPCRNLDFSPGEPFQTSELQNYKISHF